MSKRKNRYKKQQKFKYRTKQNPNNSSNRESVSKTVDDNELASLRIKKATEQLQHFNRKKKELSPDHVIKTQIPFMSAKRTPECKQTRVTINDIYEDKLACANDDRKRWPFHPDKVDRLYRKHKLSQEWKEKVHPKYCRACLKHKWRSKVHKRPQTRLIYDRKHRPGKFLSRTVFEKSKEYDVTNALIPKKTSST